MPLNIHQPPDSAILAVDFDQKLDNLIAAPVGVSILENRRVGSSGK